MVSIPPTMTAVKQTSEHDSQSNLSGSPTSSKYDSPEAADFSNDTEILEPELSAVELDI